VVLDHRGDSGIADDRRAEHAESVATVVAPLDELERDTGGEQALGRVAA
jgi:hypothetical protein